MIELGARNHSLHFTHGILIGEKQNISRLNLSEKLSVRDFHLLTPNRQIFFYLKNRLEIMSFIKGVQFLAASNFGV